jgi:LytS/YehU family sensor histidine kinase
MVCYCSSYHTWLLLYLFVKQRERHINNLNTLTNEKTQSQLETLRSQVNPHFLFNSFNTLVSEIETNPADAVIYVERMADFYRSIIQLREKILFHYRMN